MRNMGEKLFKRSQEMRSKEQFVQLAEQYMDTVFRFAFSYLKSKADADDVTQNVLLKLYQTDRDFESEAHLKHWLLRVTANECKTHWRSKWSRMEDFEDYAGSLVFEEPRYSDLFYAVMALDRKYRTVIVLHYYEGYGVAEIANLLGVPQGTVGTRLRRARERLKQYLVEETCDE